MLKKQNILLAAIFIFFAAVNSAAILKTNTPLVYDESDYFLFSFQASRILNLLFASPAVSTAKNAETLYKNYAELPPMFGLSIAPLHFIPGFNQRTAPLANIAYMFLLMLSLYKLGTLIKDKKTGILAAFITLSTPSVFAFSRTLFMDFAFTAVSSMYLYLTIRTYLSRSTKDLMILSAATAIGMLYKYTFLAYIFIPLCVTLSSLPADGRKKRITLFVALALLLSWPYYITPFFNWEILSKIMDYYIFKTISPGLSPAQGYPEKLLLYIRSLCANQLGIFHSVLLILSIPVFIRLKSPKITLKLKSILLIWIAVPLLLLPLTPLPTNPVNPRHMLPVIPAAAMMISLFVFSFQDFKIDRKILPSLKLSLKISADNPRFNNIFCLLICVLSGTMFCMTSLRGIFLPQAADNNSQRLYGERYNHGVLRPLTLDLKQTEIFNALKEFGQKIVFVPDTPFPAIISNLDIENTLRSHPLDLFYMQFYRSGLSPDGTEKNINDIISGADCFVAIRTQEALSDPEGLFQAYTPRIHDLIEQAFLRQKDHLILRGTFASAEKEISIYTRRKQK